jgi:hypothetical protein
MTRHVDTRVKRGSIPREHVRKFRLKKGDDPLCHMVLILLKV